MNPQSILLTVMLLLAIEINSEILPRTDCLTRCGNLSIPFPFGTTADCYLDDTFLITCNHSFDPPKPFLNSGSIEVLEISLDGLMRISSSVASDCYDDSGAQINGTISDLKFMVDWTRNKFTAIGSDTYELIEGFEEWKQMSAGCVSCCDSINSVVNETCSGIGCCQTLIPEGVKHFPVKIRNFRNQKCVESFNRFGYTFVVEPEAFEFLSSDVKILCNRKTVPVVLDWSVGNVTCQEAQKNLSSYACRAIHSECSDSGNGFGYHCHCMTGFQGNPYLANGCRDIDEYTSLKPCKGMCTNLPGNYSRSYPEGFQGDGKKDGSVCHPKSRKTLLYIVSGLMVTAVGSSWIFWRHKQRKVVKLRQKLFKRNGGLILQNMLSRQSILQVFTAEDLKRATDNYDDSKILQMENHLGTSYEGELHNQVNGKVTIKMLHALDECDLEVFISNLVTLSQINHGNIVKLIGCCLETQIPILVYEYIGAKTLYDYIHDDDLVRSLTWDVRLKIATETAGALAYMHSAAPKGPIFHGRLTSSSILLHHDYSVKVDDFSLTCSEHYILPFYMDEIGYIDPENFISGQLTIKSDVYSFGVVLAELLTGKIMFHPTNVSDFVSLPRGRDLLQVVDHRLVAQGKIEQLMQVDKLAQRCLSSSSVYRPTMTEVVNALKSIISSTTISPNSSEGQLLIEL